jgi:hypothetical protein
MNDLLKELLDKTKEIRIPLDRWEIDRYNNQVLPINYDLIKVTTQGIIKFIIYNNGNEWYLDDKFIFDDKYKDINKQQYIMQKWKDIKRIL